MEINVSAFVICFMLTAQFVDFSSAVSCYSCGSLLSFDNDCEDPFSSDGVETDECSAGCQKSKVESDGKQFILRGCASVLFTSKEGCETQTVSGVEANYCFCNSELCNSATTSKVSMGLFMLLTVGRMFYKWIV